MKIICGENLTPIQRLEQSGVDLFPLQVFLRAYFLNASVPCCAQMVQISILSLPVCIREQQNIFHGKIQKGRVSVHSSASRNTDGWEVIHVLRKLLAFIWTIFSPLV